MTQLSAYFFIRDIVNWETSLEGILSKDENIQSHWLTLQIYFQSILWHGHKKKLKLEQQRRNKSLFIANQSG